MSETTTTTQPVNSGGTYYDGQPLTPELLTAAFAAKVDGIGGQMYGATISSSTLTGGKAVGTAVDAALVGGKALSDILASAPAPSPLLADMTATGGTSPSTAYAGDVHDATMEFAYPPAGVTTSTRLSLFSILYAMTQSIVTALTFGALTKGTSGNTDPTTSEIFRVAGAIDPGTIAIGSFNGNGATSIQPNGNGTAVTAPVSSLMQLLFGTDDSSPGYADSNIKGSSRTGMLPFLEIGGEAPSSSTAKGVKGAVIVPYPSDGAPSYAYICLTTAETDGGGNWVRFALTSSF